MAGQHDGGAQRGELRDRAPGLRGIEVVGVERHARRLRPAVHVGHVEAVGDERHAVALAPQADQAQARGRAGRRPRSRRAGRPRDGAVDMHGPAVPHEAVAEAVQQPHVERQVLRSPVVAATGALRLLDGVRVAEDVGVGTQGRRGAAVIGVAVTEDDREIPPCGCAATIAWPCPSRRRRRRGRRRARRSRDEVDVHRPEQAASQQPDAVGDLLGRSGGQRAKARTRAELRRTSVGHGGHRRIFADDRTRHVVRASPARLRRGPASDPGSPPAEQPSPVGS